PLIVASRGLVDCVDALTAGTSRASTRAVTAAGLGSVAVGTSPPAGDAGCPAVGLLSDKPTAIANPPPHSSTVTANITNKSASRSAVMSKPSAPKYRARTFASVLAALGGGAAARSVVAFSILPSSSARRFD